MANIIGAAEYYQLRGLAVFPVNGKIPVTDHGVKDATLDLDAVLTQTRKRADGTTKSSRKNTLSDWLVETNGIGIAIPPGFVVVDIDPRNGGDATVATWLDDADEELRSCFADAPCVETGGGGWHYWFRHDGPLVKTIGGVDFQREGKYVVAPPSPGYAWLNRLPENMADVPRLPAQLVKIATPAPVVHSRSEYAPSGEHDELDEAAHRYTDWTALLGRHGWAPAGQNRWRHPASENQFSATIRNDCLFVYSPNTPFDVTSDSDPHGYTLFRAITTLDFRGDAKETVREFRRRGLLPETVDAATVDRRMSHVVAASKGVPPERAAERGRTEHHDQDDEHGPRLLLRDFGDVQIARARWLWKERIPCGALTLLAGREGEGKSTIAIDAIARVTRGRSKGEFFGVPRDALIVATEDSFEHTIKPRLLAAGADIDRCLWIEMREHAEALELPTHITDLEAAMEQRDIALIVLDPLLSRLEGKLDSHKDADVRQALEPLGAFAARTGVSILGLIHLNKSGSTDPLQAVMASRAFTAFARSVLFAMVDPDNDNRRLLGLVKSNLGRLDVPTLTYTFEPVVVGYDDGDIVATRILWGPDSELRIGEALAQAGVDPSKVLDAGEWLVRYLDEHDGSASPSDIDEACTKKKISFSTVKRARKRLGIVAERSGFQGGSQWHYPDGRKRHVDPDDEDDS